MEKDIKIGAKIKKMREWRNITQETLAKALEISQSSYSKIEIDETDVSLRRILQICDTLEISLPELLAMDTAKSPCNHFHIEQSQIDYNGTNYVYGKELQTIYELRTQDLHKRIDAQEQEIARLHGLLEKVLRT